MIRFEPCKLKNKHDKQNGTNLASLLHPRGRRLSISGASSSTSLLRVGSLWFIALWATALVEEVKYWFIEQVKANLPSWSWLEGD